MVQSNQNNLMYTKIFVGNLSWRTAAEDLINVFEQHGEVLHANVPYEYDSNKNKVSRGYGFVTFRNFESANRACLRGIHDIDGRPTNCNFAYLGARNNQINNGQIAPPYQPPQQFIYPQVPLPYHSVPPYGQANSFTYGQHYPIMHPPGSTYYENCNYNYNYGNPPQYVPQQIWYPTQPLPAPVNNGVNNYPTNSAHVAPPVSGQIAPMQPYIHPQPMQQNIYPQAVQCYWGDPYSQSYPTTYNNCDYNNCNYNNYYGNPPYPYHGTQHLAHVDNDDNQHQHYDDNEHQHDDDDDDDDQETPREEDEH